MKEILDLVQEIAVEIFAVILVTLVEAVLALLIWNKVLIALLPFAVCKATYSQIFWLLLFLKMIL